MIIKSQNDRLPSRIRDEDSMRSSNQGLIKKIDRITPSIKISIFLIFILQLVLVLIILNPINISNQLSSVQIINKVTNLVSAPPSEIPVFARVGDNKNLPDIDTLKKENSANALVYKDAQNGDYVLGYSSKLIIFRDSENKIIYEGDSPQTVETKNNQNLISAVVAQTKAEGLIPQDSSETPAVYIVADASKLKGTNSFYSDIENGDIQATFNPKSLILIYRPSTDKIIKSGTVKATITE